MLWTRLPPDEKTLERARKAECTPVAIDRTEETADFRGKSGEYQTTMFSCTCKSYCIKDAPCKHMYRLAMELGYIKADFTSDATKIPTPELKRSTGKAGRRNALKIAVELLEPNREVMDFVYSLLLHPNDAKIVEDISKYDLLTDNGLVLTEPTNPPLLPLGVKRTNQMLVEAGYLTPNDKPLKGKEIEEKREELSKVLYPNARSVRINKEGYLYGAPKMLRSYIYHRLNHDVVMFTLNAKTDSEADFSAGANTTMVHVFAASEEEALVYELLAENITRYGDFPPSSYI